MSDDLLTTARRYVEMPVGVGDDAAAWAAATAHAAVDAAETARAMLVAAESAAQSLEGVEMALDRMRETMLQARPNPALGLGATPPPAPDAAVTPQEGEVWEDTDDGERVRILSVYIHDRAHCWCEVVERGTSMTQKWSPPVGTRTPRHIAIHDPRWRRVYPAPAATPHPFGRILADRVRRVRERPSPLTERERVVADGLAAIAMTEREVTAEAQASEGARRITAERERQMADEAWTPEHDDTHDQGELAVAAAAYALHGIAVPTSPAQLWPWEPEGWKPKDKLRNLERAGALIAAEIDRLCRSPLAWAAAERERHQVEREDTARRWANSKTQREVTPEAEASSLGFEHDETRKQQGAVEPASDTDIAAIELTISTPGIAPSPEEARALIARVRAEQRYAETAERALEMACADKEAAEAEVEVNRSWELRAEKAEAQVALMRPVVEACLAAWPTTTLSNPPAGKRLNDAIRAYYEATRDA